MSSSSGTGRVGARVRGNGPRSQLSSSSSNLDDAQGDEASTLLRGEREPDLMNEPNDGNYWEGRDGGKDAEPGDEASQRQDTNQDGKTGEAGDNDAGTANTSAGTAGGRRGRGGNNRSTAASSSSGGNNNADDIENQGMAASRDLTMGPMRVLDPIRADPIKALQARQKRLERIAATSIPEIHFVGQISSGLGLLEDSTEGACVRWKVDTGKAWEHLGGEMLGQTQIAYCRTSDQETVPFNHPLDLHFAQAGMQGWGNPRIAFQCYKLDWHGRRLLVGYAFEHLPTSPGPHRMEINLWRPVGSPEQELDSFLLGRVPALVSHEPIYESAWRERCRIVTTAAGKIYVDLFVVTRNHHLVGMDDA